ncbi:hypothetical protein SAMN05421874_12892 [Nonomuraea maritima]|uniref:Uncharacterized protein n=1 Tax=Nonomuraea maritima TaxID=683260 RepID=A0A1G9MLJ5_9ACTN|nr:hypothetical protein [Nonomuraea maritima]SDL75152.1 hypothetical protein SAMN05421874_12892 [Nonomuraea maritima]
MSGYTIIPQVIAYSGEIVDDPIIYVPDDGTDRGERLSYQDPKSSDYLNGVLRARVKTNRAGVVRMRKLNTRRQWACMDHGMCQVCGKFARDPQTKRLWWLLVPPVFEQVDVDSGRTNAPPICQTCIPFALRDCPMLLRNVTLWSVGWTESAGVLGDLYRPNVCGIPHLKLKNVFVPWDNFRRLPDTLATSQVLLLKDMRQHDLPEPAPPDPEPIHPVGVPELAWPPPRTQDRASPHRS